MAAVLGGASCANDVIEATTSAEVPEPGPMTLLAAGLLGFVLVRCRTALGGSFEA